MIIKTILLLFPVFTITIRTISAKAYGDKLDRYIVACHSTDYLCFKRQYQLLRDHVLMGSKQLDIPMYQAYMFHYSDTDTCVKITGVEDSVLVALNFDGLNKKFSISIAMPVRLQQVEYKVGSITCKQPNRVFPPKGEHIGPLKKFAGNATVQVTFPFKLHTKKNDVYMVLEEDNLDVILDIPDLSQYDKESALESKLFEWSEWAYSMVQHVDVAEHVMVPYTDQLKKLFIRMPLERFILLYPTEEYSCLQIKYCDSVF